ncbi:MAG: pitrilysin family protein [Bacteroidia bacterium]
MKGMYLCAMLTEKEINHVFELQNGLKVLFRPSAGETGHLAVIINAGTRDEEEEKNGLAHFIEHTLFKGTKTRKAIKVISGLDAVGGELNAYTTKEETCIYGSFHKRHLIKATELISDIIMNSVFPEEELIREKEVIAEEIRSCLDNPSEQLFDDFETQVFKNHPLGKNILGTEKSLRGLKRSDILSFLKKFYKAENMVVGVTGPFTLQEVKKIVAEYFSEVDDQRAQKRTNKVLRRKAQQLTVTKDIHQTHAVIGARAFPLSHKLRTACGLLTNILGGPAMNSKLNLSLRERKGYAYTVEAGYHMYSDNGMVHIYFGTDHKNTSRCLNLIDKELQKFMTKSMSSVQLHQSKIQIEGQLAIAEENKLNTMLGLSKQLLHKGKVQTLADTIKKVETVTASDILETANQVFDPEYRQTLIFTGA